MKTNNEIPLSDLQNSLANIVYELKDSIKPFAQSITTNILSSFWDTAKSDGL